ncbi:hypothetical protein K491DRAFT_715663 [Lophiostoma macrostomum CBS 122681]|uniref:Uncharacterized protein n=1 Tax=Lophiostoma macrostomum CBS 122681 TaxID=1314788 RepID=A0A6A6T820_9PLEO|nr:hypothetical protein K491DRAFT_715663 [Lophiostoma macrostomum CBS 122681]
MGNNSEPSLLRVPRSSQNVSHGTPKANVQALTEASASNPDFHVPTPTEFVSYSKATTRDSQAYVTIESFATPLGFQPTDNLPSYSWAARPNPVEIIYSANGPDRPLWQRPNNFQFVKPGLLTNMSHQTPFVVVFCVFCVLMMLAPWIAWYWLRVKDQKAESRKQASHADWIRLKSMTPSQTPKRAGLEKIAEAEDEYRDAV